MQRKRRAHEDKGPEVQWGKRLLKWREEETGNKPGEDEMELLLGAPAILLFDAAKMKKSNLSSPHCFPNVGVILVMKRLLFIVQWRLI